ncbi:hypothetical protein LGR54_10100 [Ancylobacter sp. Lp-2]|uniref:hypothetical protein n=1 Tax=Ancylobacter sp. Lp-2 TaxID=2881339 RepID=UPI001E456C00|nr:hypothetical protein [Ancylobacter sp. Lp-2]MCB4768956.1 hypothetical protein [Ancylobacter sp. Lp-2]
MSVLTEMPMRYSQPRRATLRASRDHDAAEAIAARVAALRPFLGPDIGERRTRLARLLRIERRAALSGIGYDPARHAALRRLEAETAAELSRRGAGAPASCRRTAPPRDGSFHPAPPGGARTPRAAS